MMKSGARVFISALVALSMFSCTKEEASVSVSLYLRTSEVSAESGQVFLEVKANCSWTLNTSADWAEFVKGDESGTGNSNSVRLKYKANESDSLSRTLTISATVNGVVASEIPFSQKSRKKENIGDDTVVWDFSKDYIADYTSDTSLELPETFPKDGRNIISHKMNISGKVERNFAYYWEYDNMVASWVAYPLNSGLIGSGYRTDAWGLESFDFISEAMQPVLYSGYSSNDGSKYDRGHQIPSADRLARSANVQTFYGTNMTPQLNSFNTGIWSACEEKVRKWAKACDTLYVVTGCVTKGSTKYALDNVGQHVTVPVAYFKACLCYFQDAKAGYNGYMAAGMYFDHAGAKASSFGRDLSCSISELEGKLGYKLFVNLPAKVGESTAEKIKKEDPANVSWWW